MNRLFTLLIFILSSCSNNNSLEKVLALSGSNRGELEKVLAHYSKNDADSLKLRAAKFLIKNMPGHYTYGGEYMDNYIKTFDSLNPYPTIYQRSYFYSFPLQKPFIVDLLEKRYDIENITSDFLISNIDYKFKLLEATPFGKDIHFDDFCEYILPYRIDVEPLIGIRQGILDTIINNIESEFKKNKYSESTMSDFINSSEAVFKYKNNYTTYVRLPNNELYSTSDCDFMSNTTMERIRLIGVPAMIDFAPHWANANGRHNWCTIQDINNKNVKLNYIERSKMAKVYRKTYSHNKSPKPDKNFIPYIFNPFCKDVTDEYIYTSDIVIPYKECVEKEIRNVYLSVFNELQWRPIAWSEVNRKGNAHFDNLGRDVVYLPLYYEEEEAIVADYPFILNNNGSITNLIPNDKNKIKLHIERKSPIEFYKRYWSKNIIGAIIEASNNANYTNSDTLAVIKEHVSNSVYEIPIHTTKDYRYIRIIQKQDERMWLSELSFQDANRKKIDGNFFTPSQSDNIRTSFYDTKQDRLKPILTNGNYIDFATIPHWIGIDFGKRINVSSVNIGLRNDGNYIYPNETYQLLYHNNKEWVSFEVKVANDSFIEFDNVPSGALYWIRNLTKGKEERIFTYENGEMKFW